MMKQLILFTLVLVSSCASQLGFNNATAQGDEQAIREYYDSWIEATTVGDLELALSLIADKAVFLVPGADPMDKQSFAFAATAPAPDMDFELDCEIQEIEVLGDHAWLLTRLGLVVIDKQSKARFTMAGHALSILERKGESWVVVREANTMVPVVSGE